MKRPATRILAGVAVAVAAIAIVAGVRRAARGSSAATSCASGFRRAGARCLPAPGVCPSPLVATPRGCDEPERDVVRIPRTTLTLGPSDWRAEGLVRPRVVTAGPLAIDRLEVSVGRARCPTCPLRDDAAFARDDPARAASGVTLDEARRACRARGGRLPTEDEWIAAAAGAGAHRYPWGDTGAVCRRAAWGLVRGPCASGADGPDTVGAHPDGASPLGVEDLSGNVAEWVETGACPPEVPPKAGRQPEGPRPAPPDVRCLAVVRGGSYRSTLATELRTWERLEVSASSRNAWIGFRCAYDELPSPVP